MIATEIGTVAWDALAVARAAAPAHAAFDAYLVPTEAARRREIELTKEIEELRNSAVIARRSIGGIHAPTLAAQAMAARCEVLRSRLAAMTKRLNDEIAESSATRAAITVLRTSAELRSATETKLRDRLAVAHAEQAILLDRADAACADRDSSTAAAARVAARQLQARTALDLKLTAVDEAADAEALAARKKAASVIAPSNVELALLSELHANEKALKIAEADATTTMAQVDAFDTAFSIVARDTGAENVTELTTVWTANEDANWNLVTSTAVLQAEREKFTNEARTMRATIARASTTAVAAAKEAAVSRNNKCGVDVTSSIDHTPLLRSISNKAPTTAVVTISPLSPLAVDEIARDVIAENIAVRAEVEKLRLAVADLVDATGAGNADAVTALNLLESLAASERHANLLLPKYAAMVAISRGIRGGGGGLNEKELISSLINLGGPMIPIKEENDRGLTRGGGGYDNVGNVPTTTTIVS